MPFFFSSPLPFFLGSAFGIAGMVAIGMGDIGIGIGFIGIGVCTGCMSTGICDELTVGINVIRVPGGMGRAIGISTGRGDIAGDGMGSSG